MSLGAPSLAKPSRTPELACRDFTTALGAGELEAATACFARDGCLITPDATAVRGREGIRDVLAQLTLRHTQIRIEFSTTLATADVALLHERWKIRADGAGGGPFVQISSSTLVLRQIEGEWKLSIVAPWGVAGRAVQSEGERRAGRRD
jgi:ketosteroid isomerase-like protein